MANSVQILAKIARDAAQLGLTVNSQSATAVVIENGSNDLTISYVAASIQAPMGGVDPTVSPYLGIGVANPGKIKISAPTTTDTVPAVIDSVVAAKVLCLCAGFANDLQLASDAGATVVAEIRGHADLIGMGQ
jgi:hypothetical protein